MKVGVYVDGFNVYYGARAMCGRGTPGWRWLDLRALANSLVAASTVWPGAAVERIVYCTARIDPQENPGGYADQDVYLLAIQAAGTVDWIEYGNYVNRVKRAPLATPDPNGRPILTTSTWPLMIRDANQQPTPNATFMVSYARREEKASDVNVASHLLVDVFTGAIEAAIVVSNDSDLRFPIKEARQRLPVGTVNPSLAQLAGALRGLPTDGSGRHWWRRLTPADYTGNQLPNPCAGHARPAGW